MQKSIAMVSISVMALTLVGLAVGVAWAQRYVPHPTPNSLILMPWPRRNLPGTVHVNHSFIGDAGLSSFPPPRS